MALSRDRSCEAQRSRLLDHPWIARAANASHAAVAGCRIVVYTAALFPHWQQALRSVPDLGIGPPASCAVAFVDQPAEQLPARLGFWSLVSAHPLSSHQRPSPSPSTSSQRQASRIPKMRPDIFFGSRPTVHMDATKLNELDVRTPVDILVDRALTRCNASFAAFAHDHRSDQPLAEFDAIRTMGRTSNNTALYMQARRYINDDGWLAALAGSRIHMIEGRMLMQDGSHSAVRFGCHWLDEYSVVDGADRDQPAFSYVLWKLHLQPCMRAAEGAASAPTAVEKAPSTSSAATQTWPLPVGLPAWLACTAGTRRGPSRGCSRAHRTASAGCLAAACVLGAPQLRRSSEAHSSSSRSACASATPSGVSAAVGIPLIADAASLPSPV
eukprot:CAMPEP_0183336084 /NCGR_PEP_ID=MMETSP0164_2-20130417/4176_1 /TAXON_ID=221442 /ORGANISM="Coccolithus pelagicus ssp braarudi, Strain PLY182g" /LENGTH=383 /DNA_ID=CAMNT_0025505547 /DNA_START=61 /DNA_END=1209 /DNA_ORIENTATION=+